MPSLSWKLYSPMPARLPSSACRSCSSPSSVGMPSRTLPGRLQRYLLYAATASALLCLARNSDLWMVSMRRWGMRISPSSRQITSSAPASRRSRRAWKRFLPSSMLVCTLRAEGEAPSTGLDEDSWLGSLGGSREAGAGATRKAMSVGRFGACASVPTTLLMSSASEPSDATRTASASGRRSPPRLAPDLTAQKPRPRRGASVVSGCAATKQRLPAMGPRLPSDVSMRETVSPDHGACAGTEAAFEAAGLVCRSKPRVRGPAGLSGPTEPAEPCRESCPGLSGIWGHTRRGRSLVQSLDPGSLEPFSLESWE
mmetsp:Transcript_3099/g.9088  ORF Transcript_3099/g.9088 Transcript_3099/m.9088 type:complete len:312 (-) Transcript_3099:115-1050(-)